MTVFGYRNSIVKSFRFVHLPIFTVVVLVMCVQAIQGKVAAGSALSMAAAWIWIAYWWFWRMCHTLEVEGTTLRWWSGLRRGTVEIADLTGARNLFGLPGSMQTLRRRSGRPIIVAAQGPGWLQFLEELNAHHPEHPFQASRSSRFAAKWPGSGFGSKFYQR